LSLLAETLGLGRLAGLIRSLLERLRTVVQSLVQKAVGKLLGRKEIADKCQQCPKPKTKRAVAAMALKGSGLKPKSCSGQCFAAGTLVRGVVALTPIQSLTCGLRVVSYVAGERIDVEPLPLVIDPLAWRAVQLVLIEPGYRLDATLLRPLNWLRGRCVGASVWLDLPQVGVRGFATIVEIAACPPLEVGTDGRLITGTFCHSHGEVWDLVVEGEPQPIGGTAAHPVWSDDRLDWVPLGQLRIGERVRVFGGPRWVQGVTLRPGTEPVYNIEVEGDHCYRVGQQGLLVHNASNPCILPGFPDLATGSFKKYKDLDGMSRASGVQARLTKLSIREGGSEASGDPAGWVFNFQPRGTIGRGHLLAQDLGGRGDIVRNLVVVSAHNQPTNEVN
jgi:hypothetical protein